MGLDKQPLPALPLPTGDGNLPYDFSGLSDAEVYSLEVIRLKMVRAPQPQDPAPSSPPVTTLLQNANGVYTNGTTPAVS